MGMRRRPGTANCSSSHSSNSSCSHCCSSIISNSNSNSCCNHRIASREEAISQDKRSTGPLRWAGAGSMTRKLASYLRRYRVLPVHHPTCKIAGPWQVFFSVSHLHIPSTSLPCKGPTLHIWHPFLQNTPDKVNNHHQPTAGQQDIRYDEVGSCIVRPRRGRALLWKHG